MATVPSQIYTCSAGDTFDLVALRVYGDEKYACELLAANPALCHLMTFRGGELLAVPALTIDEDEDGNAVSPPPWKQ